MHFAFVDKYEVGVKTMMFVAAEFGGCDWRANCQARSSRRLLFT